MTSDTGTGAIKQIILDEVQQTFAEALVARRSATGFAQDWGALVFLARKADR